MAVKILFFIENLSGGGAEKVLCNLVNAMNRKKFEITVETLWRGEAARYLKDGIRYRYCYSGENRMNQYRSRIEAAAGLTYPFYIKDDYDIEVAYLEFGSTKILSRSTNKHAKKIAWVHSDLKRKLDNAPNALEKAKKQYDAFDSIVCVSQTVKDSFVELFGREEDTVVLYNTLNESEIRRLAQLTPAELPAKKRLTVVAAGRLAVEKQYDMLLRVHKRLLDNDIEHDLWIVGEGSEREKLEAYISDNHLVESVTLLGFQTNPYPYMRNADILVCSSRYEGLSTFVAEGLILGKPIVTTDCSGMRELLGDSEYGLITENSEEALFIGMKKMLETEAERKRYAKLAGIRGEAFSERSLTEKTEQFFLNIVED